jgi:hypothetical protein
VQHFPIGFPQKADERASGPINTLAVHPQGKAYASGAEDGFVRVHWVSVLPVRKLSELCRRGGKLTWIMTV